MNQHQDLFTPAKFNIAPEKCWLEVLEDYFPIGKVTFQGRAVKLREGNNFCQCFTSENLETKTPHFEKETLGQLLEGTLAPRMGVNPSMAKKHICWAVKVT